MSHSASWGVHPASHCQSSPDPALPYSPAATTVHTGQQPPSNHSSASSPNRGVFEEPGFYHFCPGLSSVVSVSITLHHPCISAAPAAGRAEMVATPLQTWELGRRPDGCSADARVARRTSAAAAGELCSSRAPPPPRPPSAARAVQMQRGKANKMSQPPTRPRPHL